MIMQKWQRKLTLFILDEGLAVLALVQQRWVDGVAIWLRHGAQLTHEILNYVEKQHQKKPVGQSTEVTINMDTVTRKCTNKQRQSGR